MAKKKAPLPPKTSEGEARRNIISIRGTESWRAWLMGLAAHPRPQAPDVVDPAFAAPTAGGGFVRHAARDLGRGLGHGFKNCAHAGCLAGFAGIQKVGAQETPIRCGRPTGRWSVASFGNDVGADPSLSQFPNVDNV